MKSHDLRQQSGISLAEVLITMTVLGFGLLGVAGFQTTVAANMYTAHQHAQAAALAESMVEKLRANRVAVLAGLYLHKTATAPAAPNKNCAETSCIPSELAAWDMAIWHSMMAGSNKAIETKIPAGPFAILPLGQTAITCQDSPCTEYSVRFITIYWDAHRRGADGIGCDPNAASDLTCFRLAYVP